MNEDNIDHRLSVTQRIRVFFFGSEHLKYQRFSSFSPNIKEDIIRRASDVFLVLVFFAMLIVFMIIYRMIEHYYRNGQIEILVTELIISPNGKILGTISLLTIGLILFYVKIKWQLYYGLLETAFSLVSGFFLMENVQRLISFKQLNTYSALPIMTTVYLVVRGLSNIYDGLKKDRKKT